MQTEKIGFTIGKFAPLHKGHQFLIETALQEMDKFIIVIYETNKINIPIEQRAKWIKTLYPETQILFAYNPPMQYGLDPESVKIQMKYLEKYVQPYAVTHFYSSEPYGEKVAEYLGIIDRRVDAQRINFPISATHIRNELEKYRTSVPDIVWKDCKHAGLKFFEQS